MSAVSPAHRHETAPLDRSSEPTACFHCGLPVPSDRDYSVVIDEHPRPMCCPGCQAVAKAIVDGGLTDYYRYRTATPDNPDEAVPAFLDELSLYDDPAIQASFVRDTEETPGKPATGEVKEAALILEGIVCAACVWLNERHVGGLPGVHEFRVNYSTHRAHLRWDAARIRLSEILEAIAAIGYRAHPFDPSRQEAVHRRERARQLRRLGVAGLGMVQAMMIAVALYAGEAQHMDPAIREFLRWISLIIATPVVFYSAASFFENAARDLRYRRLGMDVPVSLAIGLAYTASAWATFSGAGEIYFDSVTMFTFFLLAGRYLEVEARQRAGEAADNLLRLLPARALRLDTGIDGALTETSVPPHTLTPGDRVRVRPGETVPADGRIEDGRSSLDESLLTGESRPRARGPGDTVIGGAINRESPLIVRIERVGPDTVLSGIQRLLDRAQTEKPRIAGLADRVAGYFVAGVLIVASTVALAWWFHRPEDALWVTLSVLVVTCPCALSLATPAALTAATGRLMQRGVLTTRGHALETLARLETIVFDKTGTLTEGRLELVQVEPRSPWDRDTARRYAAALEQASEHPLAQALSHTTTELPPVEDLTNIPGQGITGRIAGATYRIGNWDFVHDGLSVPADEALRAQLETGGPVVYLADTEAIRAVFYLRDRPRPEAATTLTRLDGMGIATHLISGDDPRVTEAVAAEVGLPRTATVAGDQQPSDKLTFVKQQQEQGTVTAMVGDGVNDAPVLAGASVSFAMGGASQIARSSADLVLLRNDLREIPEAIAVGRRTLRIIRQNMTWALTYNLLALPAAALGWIAPWMAAIGMSASSLLVVLNALRLRSDPVAPSAEPSPEDQPRNRAVDPAAFS